jgi:hypothetical protein
VHQSVATWNNSEVCVTTAPREKAHQRRLQSTASVPLPKEVTFVTFDVYGTLIDSDTGIYEAFSKEAEKDGYTIARDELIALFKETQKEIKSGSYELSSAGRRSRRPTRSSSASRRSSRSG